MNAVIVTIDREQEPTRTSIPVSRSMRAAAHFNSTHVARMATKGSGYRICVGTRAGDRQCLPSLNGRPSEYPGNLPAIHPPIRRPLSADTGVLIAASRLIALRFNSFRPLAGWSFHALLKPLQKSQSGIVKCLQVLFLSAQTMGLAAGVYGQHIGRSETKCPNQDGTNPYRYRAKA